MALYIAVGALVVLVAIVLAMYIQEIWNELKEKKAMGEVAEAVKGTGASRSSKTPSNTGKNLRDQVRALADEVSTLVAKKDDDALTEGDAAKPENVRKAALLRASASMLRAVTTLLEDY